MRRIPFGRGAYVVSVVYVVCVVLSLFDGTRCVCPHFATMQTLYTMYKFKGPVPVH